MDYYTMQTLLSGIRLKILHLLNIFINNSKCSTSLSLPTNPQPNRKINLPTLHFPDIVLN